jgi:aspartate dehydrogenase
MRIVIFFKKKNKGSLKITMKKYPTSLKVESILMEKLKKYIEDSNQTNEFILYEGPVRDLCPLAPNNVNTIACAALAAHNLGFDGVYARLIADKNLKNAHIIDIEVTGPIKSNKEEMFQVHTTRYNPANPGEVTGAATYSSFLSSLLMAHSKGNGFHFC